MFGNPQRLWCYADEDLVGLQIEVAESCHVLTFATISLSKWLLLAFEDDECDDEGIGPVASEGDA